MLFYFVRHGQTEPNVLGLMAGSGLDVPLTEVGHQSARELAETIRDQIGHPVQHLWASDLLRARQTAAYLAEALGHTVKIEPDLREWHLGEWEGKPFMEYRHLLLGEGEPLEGESRKRFYARVESAWRKVHSNDEPYVMVSHGAVWLALQDLLGMSRFKIDNCQLVKVYRQDDRWLGQVL